VERPWAEAKLDAQLFSLPKAPKPGAGDLYWWLERDFRNDLAERTGAEAIWTGQGGDHLFWAFRTFPIAADYISRHGIDLGLLRVVSDAARLGNRSYLSVLRTAFELGRSQDPWTPDDVRAREAYFVNADALPENRDEYVAHPWTSGAASLPKAKQIQISLLAEVLNRHRHMPGAEHAYQRHPLLSGPLIELCLQIPIYVLVQGGQRRALARKAFCDRVPREIIEREDKGDTTARVRTMIRQNEPFLREILLTGILARERIVSKHELETILVDGQSYRPENSWPLLACISAEIWARTWTTTAPRV
jgi:asparagine synthase (glutamine-hydrolysing)